MGRAVTKSVFVDHVTAVRDFTGPLSVQNHKGGCGRGGGGTGVEASFVLRPVVSRPRGETINIPS